MKGLVIRWKSGLSGIAHTVVMELKAEIKRFRNQAADARRSREQKRAKEETLAADVTQALQAAPTR